MSAVPCVFLSAVTFYLSIGLGDIWWLVWLAPIPILWLALGQSKPSAVVVTAWLAYALGSTNILRAYVGVLPISVLVLAITGPALLFALAVLGTWQVHRRLGAIAALFAFALLWAAVDFLVSLDSANGSVLTPAAATVAAPVLIQTASLVGFVGITFLLGAFSAGIALSLRTHKSLPAIVGTALLLANALYGFIWISPPTGFLRVALVASDDKVGKNKSDDKPAAFAAIEAYVAEIEKLRSTRPALIVLPENISRIAPEWRAEVDAKLAATATATQATLIVGFNTRIDEAQRNVALAFTPGATHPTNYAKRRLVPVLETTVFSPGTGPVVLASGIAVEICKDMDFANMIRDDMVATKATLLAVPAWDFDQDRWSHARVAILRSVENGVPMARSARNGLLTLSDKYGRVVAVTNSAAGIRTLVGELPLSGPGGGTTYAKIGNAFGWLSCVLGTLLVGMSSWRRTTRIL